MIDYSPTKRAKRNHPMPDLNEFYTTQEAADKLGFTLQGVSKLIRQKKVDGIRFVL